MKENSNKRMRTQEIKHMSIFANPYEEMSFPLKPPPSMKLFPHYGIFTIICGGYIGYLITNFWGYNGKDNEIIVNRPLKVFKPWQ